MFSSNKPSIRLMINCILFLVLMVFLAGCETTKVLVKQKELVPFELRKELVTPVKEPAPPARVVFINASPDQQRDQFFFFSTNLQKNLQTCNDNLEAIDKVYQSHQNRVKTFNEQEAARVAKEMK